MPRSARLARSFYSRPTLTVARHLLGQRLVRIEPDGMRVSGLIVEAEAYIGTEDLGCHAHSGRTPRNTVMWGQAGHAYVYFTYGMHWMLNVVTEAAGKPAAVLLRAVLPLDGLSRIRRRRAGQPPRAWTDGPAKLCQAFAVDSRLNGHDLCSPTARLFIERRPAIPDSAVSIGPRVGLYTVPEPWKSIPWRFRVRQEHVDTLAKELPR